MEDQDRAMPAASGIKNGRAIDLEPALMGSGNFQLTAQHLFLGSQNIDEFGQFMQPQGFDDGSGSDLGVHTEQLGKGAIGQLNPAGFIQEQQSFGHAVEERFALGLDLKAGSIVVLLQFLQSFLGVGLCPPESGTPPKVQAGCGGQNSNCQEGPKHPAPAGFAGS
jgi:hypothetical protein